MSHSPTGDHSLFDTTNSNTQQGPYGRVDIAFGQGQTECVKVRDAVTIGGLTSDEQDMLLITTNGLARLRVKQLHRAARPV